MIELHAHTVASGHAFNTLDEMARAAAAAGIRVLGITDHGPSMDGAPTAGYFEMTARLPERLHGVRVLVGCEANILDAGGRIDLDDETAALQPLLLAGLHARTPYPRDASVAANTRAVVAAILHPAVHVISHPYTARFPTDPIAIADAAAAAHTLLEVNLSVCRSFLLADPAPGASRTLDATRLMVERLLERDGEFVVGADAHHAAELTTTRALEQRVAETLGIDLTRALNYDLDALARHVPALLADVPAALNGAAR